MARLKEQLAQTASREKSGKTEISMLKSRVNSVEVCTSHPGLPARVHCSHSGTSGAVLYAQCVKSIFCFWIGVSQAHRLPYNDTLRKRMERKGVREQRAVRMLAKR